MTTFAVPSSLQDLEREPYNLFPYPHDFRDDDEATRAESFSALVDLVEDGNGRLVNFGLSIFEDGAQDPWDSSDRRQALYTLVRKSNSLSLIAKTRLVNTLCGAISAMSSLLNDGHTDGSNDDNDDHDDAADQDLANSPVVPQAFRDAYAFHLYMLFSIMFFTESEAKGLKVGGIGRRQDKNSGADENAAVRSICAITMLHASQSMSKNRATLWQRGVPDESVVMLPCRIAYQMLESATGVLARKTAFADEALGMIAATVNSGEGLLNTILAALMDLMHSYEHMASLCVKLCTMITETPTNRLATELIREIGRLDTSGLGGNDNGKASGIKFVAPFINELAAERPKLVMGHISHLLPHLDSEPYYLRSAIITGLGHIVMHISSQTIAENQDNSPNLNPDEKTGPSRHEKSQNGLFDILEARCHDASSYTRSAALKVWINLIKEGILPVGRLNSITAMAIDRLRDKTVIVRKQAVQLMTVLLENNPFLGELDPEPYRRKLLELTEYIGQNMPENIYEAHQLALAESADDDIESKKQLERAAILATISEIDSWDASLLNDGQKELKSRADAIKFAESALELILQIESASPALHNLLLSSNSSDVSEALRFFVKARHFKLPCSIRGMKQALTLMWSTEKSIKDEVLRAFIDVFVAIPGSGGTEYLADEKIAQNLLTLASEANASEIVSIEEGLGRLVQEEKIPANVFNILWSVVAKGRCNVRATAVLVLAMAASRDRSIVDGKSRLKILLDICLEESTGPKQSWEAVRAACIALQKIERAQVDQSCAKYLILERILEQLSIVARGDWCVDSNERDTFAWFSTSEQAISALFVVSPEPEKLCSSIILGMHALTFSGTEQVHHLRLARFCHVLGHIALKLLVYTEAISSRVRRATAKKSLKRQEEASQAATASNGQSGSHDNSIEAELGMAAEVEAETERQVAEIAEQEIVGRGLVSMFGPLLVRIVSNDCNWGKSMVLMQAAVLALCKFMCVSSSFCEKHLPVLFSALAKAPSHDVTMRANTVVALGDLAFRFPNEVEPYTPRLYACLRDASTKVRRHTLMVLTHLILNDMIKVKGQVCEIALCLRDDDKRIQDMSRLLFHELSKRSNNPVYNLLPDIISQLSQDSVAKEDFRGIMSFLLGYIKKEKQNEMLIEKLALRFPKCSSIAQTANVAYCIAQLKVNEKGLKHLLDNFKLYKDSLHDDEVRKQFLSIITKIRKSGKPDLKQAVDEWETKLNGEAELGAENHRAQMKAMKSSAGGGKAKRKKVKAKSKAPLSDHDDNADY